MLCPVCKKRPAYVGLSESGPCEECHSGKPAKASGSESPVGLVGEDLRAWLDANPGVWVVVDNGPALDHDDSERDVVRGPVWSDERCESRDGDYWYVHDEVKCLAVAQESSDPTGLVGAELRAWLDANLGVWVVVDDGPIYPGIAEVCGPSLGTKGGRGVHSTSYAARKHPHGKGSWYVHDAVRCLGLCEEGE